MEIARLGQLTLRIPEAGETGGEAALDGHGSAFPAYLAQAVKEMLAVVRMFVSSPIIGVRRITGMDLFACI